jgi:tRNA U34 5-methylaminomethyl-2-thiouridine-forming methyltransferase MnmC
MNLSIVTTADGSKTIYNEQVGEHYHSRHGALQESRHVFLNAGLLHYLAGTAVNEVSVLEVGLGTGLNFLITAEYCTAKNINLNYTGIEAYPLTEEMISHTGYEEYISAPLWESFLKHYPASLGHQIDVNKYTQLTTDNRQLTTFASGQLFDVIYFDAFAAIHQPEMWNEEAISHTIKFLKPGGVFVTYAITGNLKPLGLIVEKVPGAPGKREMLRASLNK